MCFLLYCPFLILTEIMLGTGAIHALGTLLDPFMRFFFRTSGNSGWRSQWVLFAGYPAGASTTAKLREREALMPLEAERVLIVSHLCNPAVMITVIGVGFFHQITLGMFIAIIHYSSALLMGLMVRSTVDQDRCTRIYDSCRAPLDTCYAKCQTGSTGGWAQIR